MIKLILLDVDGVVTGFSPGKNSPYPSLKVTEYLKTLQNKGIPICLCTGKVSFAVKKIVQKLDLNNHHITDGGAVIIDPIDHQVIKQSSVPKSAVIDLLSQTQSYKMFWELYTLDKKYVDKSYPLSLQENPELMPWEVEENLIDIANLNNLTKVEVKYHTNDEGVLKNLVSKYQSDIDVQWALVPFLLPLKIAIITSKGVSKRTSSFELYNHYQVNPSEILAVGDTLMDWGFMEGCGYIATMANANDEMKQIILDHGGIIGKNVDNDGLIDILEHFKSKMIFNISRN